jgi:hypothetical protein
MSHSLVSRSVSIQSKLIDADEAFYKARNFEWDFANTHNIEYWKTKGNLSYGVALSSKCEQISLPFKKFLEKSKNLSSGIGFGPSCVTLEIEYKNFKTFGVLKSPVCVNLSLPSLSCS